MRLNGGNTTLSIAHSDPGLINDLEMAREVQQLLLHRGTLEIPGLDLAAACLPARELGGDFYDFLPYGSGRVALALGDVSGKGTAAALLGALTIGVLRSHTVEHPCDPPEVLAVLNDRIVEARLSSRFVAMLFAVLDSCSWVLTIANAGSPYPFHLRDGKVDVITVSGIPLGLMTGTRYESITLQLELGDVVVFASDGILECPNKKHEPFGGNRLAEVLISLPHDASAHEIASAIVSSTDAFGGQDCTLHDDRSLIALRVTDNSSLDYSRVRVIY